jgi:hypothetical protein
MMTSMMKRAWLMLGLAAIILINLSHLEIRDTVAAEVTPLGLEASTQTWLPLVVHLPQYPEFTLEAQEAARQRIEAMRKAERVEGLRDKIPPADWIETAYHGLVLDANYDVIEMNLDTVSKIQESLFTILYKPTQDEALKKYGGDVKDLFYSQQVQGKDQLVVRAAVLDALVAVSTPALQDRYAGRNRLLHGASNALVNWSEYVLAPGILEWLRQYRFEDLWIRPPQPSSEYVETCRAEGVPIPPDWPNPGWIEQGPLRFVFIGQGLNATVHAYNDPAVPGVCYALPRRDDAGAIQLLGIICQSNTTGKACFWDNRTTDNRLITGTNITLDIDTIGNGSTLAETCTDCHRGYNAFNIHPGSALDLSRAGAPGGPYVTRPDVRYTPIGQPHWVNPGPLILPAVPPDQQSCTLCHELPRELPRDRASYCTSVLQPAAMTTMPSPPFGPPPAGWPPAITNSRFVSSTNYLSSCP